MDAAEPIWLVCQRGGLACMTRVMRDSQSEIFAYFLVSFLFFAVLLRPREKVKSRRDKARQEHATKGRGAAEERSSPTNDHTISYPDSDETRSEHGTLQFPAVTRRASSSQGSNSQQPLPERFETGSSIDSEIDVHGLGEGAEETREYSASRAKVGDWLKKSELQAAAVAAPRNERPMSLFEKYLNRPRASRRQTAQTQHRTS